MTLLLTKLLAALGLTQAPSGPTTSVVTIASINGDRFLSPLNGTGKYIKFDTRDDSMTDLSNQASKMLLVLSQPKAQMASGSALPNQTLTTAHRRGTFLSLMNLSAETCLTTYSVYVFGRNALGNVTVGDLIAVNGNVTEYRSNKDYVYLTEIINPSNIRVVSSGNEVKPVVISSKTSGIIGKRDVQPPREQFSGLDNGDVFAVPNNQSLISQANPRLEPNLYGMDFWESLSGELVTIKGVTALGRQANSFGDQWVRTSL